MIQEIKDINIINEKLSNFNTSVKEIGVYTKYYSYIENDDSLETVLISDYISKDSHKKSLNKIYTGSWIDTSFQYWIGEPTKIKAWAYVKNTKNDLELFEKENKK